MRLFETAMGWWVVPDVVRPGVPCLTRGPFRTRDECERVMISDDNFRDRKSIWYVSFSNPGLLDHQQCRINTKMKNVRPGFYWDPEIGWHD